MLMAVREAEDREASPTAGVSWSRPVCCTAMAGPGTPPAGASTTGRCFLQDHRNRRRSF